jgi:hypothetical protein
MFEHTRRSIQFVTQLVSVLALLLIAMMACSASKEVSVRPQVIQGDAEVEVNGELGIAFELENPGNLPLEFEWRPSRGEISPIGDTRSATFTAPDEPGLVVIVIEAIYKDEKVAEGSMQIKVLEPAAAVAPLPTPTEEPTTEPTEEAITEEGPLSAPDSTAAPIPTEHPVTTPAPDAARPDWCVPFGRPSITNTTLQGNAQLTFPEDCAELEYINLFTGTSSGLPDDVGIWVLVYPRNRRFYPQSDDASQGFTIEPVVDGSWSITTYLGSPDSGREKFDIVVVLANSEASNFFRDKLKAWAASSSYTGLSHAELPDGIMEVQNITVLRTR